ncbi:hypothetical protein Tco_0561186 [Tanacetum coccineum]
MPTEMELTLEQTQQGVSHEVSSWTIDRYAQTPLSTSKSERLCFKTHGDTLISIDFLTPKEIVTHWFTLIVLSALRRSDNENMLSTMNLILMILKDGGGVKEVQRSFRHSDTERLSRSDEVLKLKNFKKDATLKLSKSTNQERYEHVGPEVASSQDGKVSRWRRDCAWLMISRCSRSQCQIQVQGTSSIQKLMITTTYSQENVKRTS